MIIFHAIFARKHGEAKGYPVIAAFDDAGLSSVLKAYEKFTGTTTDGINFRAAHAELQLVNDMNIVSSHDFPDPALIAKQRAEQVLSEALKARDANLSAVAAFKAAKIAANESASAIKSLSPEHQRVLSDLEAKATKAQADLDAAKKAADEAAAAETMRQDAAIKDQDKTSQAAAAEGTEVLTGAVVLPPEPFAEPVAPAEPAPAQQSPQSIQSAS